MKQKISLFWTLASILTITGCSMNPAILQNAENSECRSNLENATIQILFEEDARLKLEDNQAKLKSLLKQFINDEIPKAPYQSRNGFYFKVLGTTYRFVFEESKGICVLNLYSTSTGVIPVVTHTNTITYMNSKPVDNCYCAKPN